MDWLIKTFDDLSTNELYEVLQLRVDVFVVEQDCPYHELDGKDQAAYHLLGYEGDKLVAYSRVFPAGVVGDHASIGRVIVHQEARKKGYGQLLMKEAISFAEKRLNIDTILIHAQCYLEEFYESFGFNKVSDPYDLDGILHIDMIRLKGEEDVN